MVTVETKVGQGYERLRVCEYGERHEVYVHRLLAVSEYGLDAVTDSEVHHSNQIPWDNRPSNIEVKTPADHAQEHGGYHGERKQYHDESWLYEQYIEQGETMESMAVAVGVSTQTISNWIERHNIQSSE
jgi:hypothetical protein